MRGRRSFFGVLVRIDRAEHFTVGDVAPTVKRHVIDSEFCGGLRNFGIPSDKVVLELLFWHFHSLFAVVGRCLEAGADPRTVTTVVGLMALLLESGTHG